MDIITPFFTGTYLTFVAHYGGVLAVPNIRGGGEYGEAWHEAGMYVLMDYQQNDHYLFLIRITKFMRTCLSHSPKART